MHTKHLAAAVASRKPFGVIRMGLRCAGMVCLVLTGLVLAGMVMAAPAAAAADWPQFKRDAARSGDAAEEVLKFPLQRVVGIRFPAPIYASPAVVGGMVYIQDAQGNVACIDSRKNAVVWTTSIGGFNNTSSPAVADGKVFVGSTAGHLAILDAKTGALLKQIPAAGGVITAPALANEAVYFSTFNGQLTKIDYSGKELWSYQGGRISTVDFCIQGKQIVFLAGSGYTIFHFLVDEGDKVTVLSKQNVLSTVCPMAGPAWVGEDSFVLQSFDSEYGWFCRFRWNAKPSTVGISHDVNDSRAVPAVRGHEIYRGDRCFSIETGKLKAVWRVDAKVLYDGGFHSSPALAKDVMAVGSELGVVHFIPIGEGPKVRQPVWQFKVPTAGQPNSAVSSSPAIADGRVFFGGEDGVLYGLGPGNDGPSEATRLEETPMVDLPVKTPAKRAVAKLTGSEWPTPGGDMGFSCVSADTTIKPPFNIGWKTRIWSTYKCPMVVADGKVFCAGRMGPLTALDAGTGEILWKTHHPGVESRPGPTYADGKLLMMRVRSAQKDSPHVSGASGGPPGEGIYCHDANTGKVLWHLPMPIKYHFNHDGLVVHDGKVFIEQLDERRGVEYVALSVETGKELWRQPAKKLTTDDRPRTRRFSGVIAGGMWCVSSVDHGTVALDPATGKTVWESSDHFITNRSRVAARDNILLVFNDAGDHALDAKTGKLLWTGISQGTRYSQALTDLYMKTQGKQGVYPPAVCVWPIYVNGYWYHHSSFQSTHGSNRLVGTRAPTSGEFSLLTPKHVVWHFDFLSNACPSPSPAYGRLYYSPNAEGVIYCFENSGP